MEGAVETLFPCTDRQAEVRGATMHGETQIMFKIQTAT